MNNNTPIMEYKNDKEAIESLKEWQDRLFLNDWIIKIQLVPLTDLIGQNTYELSNKASLISIDPYCNKGDMGMTKDPHELILVHELLHLKFTLTDGVNKTTEGLFLSFHEHSLIEQMAKSLIMAKYNIGFNWFKNF